MTTLLPACVSIALFSISFAIAPAAPLLGQAPQAPATNALITTNQAALQATEVTSNGMEMWSTDTETRGVFSGNVVVTGTNLRLTCDRLEIIASGINDKSATVGKLDKFKYLLATGNVHIVQGSREANCGRAEVFPREDRLVLREKPSAADHETGMSYSGEELILFRGQRRVTGTGVNITMPSIKDLGFDKNEPIKKNDAEKSASPETAKEPANK